MMVMVMVMVMVMGMVMVMVMVMVVMVMVMMVQLMVHQKGQLNGQMNGQLMDHQKVQLKNQNQLSALIHGLVTTIVMIKTTILNVNLMEAIVVETTSTSSTALNVNALKCHIQLRLLLNVLSLGLVTVIVMIKTTLLNVTMMEVIAVKKMLLRGGIITVMSVSV